MAYPGGGKGPTVAHKDARGSPSTKAATTTAQVLPGYPCVEGDPQDSEDDGPPDPQTALREITNDYDERQPRIQTAALLAVQEVAEAAIERLFEDLYAIYAKRVTVFVKDTQLLKRILKNQRELYTLY